MWDKLTVGQFITLYDIEVNGNLNIIEKQQKMLAVIEGKDESEYDNYKYRDLMQEYGKKLSFFDNIPETKPVDYLQVATKRYKFCYEMHEITAGQYIDILAFRWKGTTTKAMGWCLMTWYLRISWRLTSLRFTAACFFFVNYSTS